MTPERLVLEEACLPNSLLWNWRLTSASHAVHKLQGCAVLRNFWKGEEKNAHHLLLAGRYGEN